MPPKVRITKENVVNTAMKLVKERGESALNARTIAAELDCSTQPIFSSFTSMEALKEAVIEGAEALVVGLTVHEAYDEINAWLTEEYGTTVQDIYETVVNDPEVEELFRYIYIESAGLDVEDDDDMEHLDEVIANIRAFSIDDFIGDERFEEMTVYEFVDGFETLPFALHENPEDFIAALRSLLEMTLAEFEDNNGMYLFTSLKNQISYVTVNELGGRVDFNFKNVLELESIEGVFKLDIIRATPSEYVEGKLDTVTTKVTAGFKIYDISKETVEIALDEDDSIIENALFDSSYSDPFDGYFAILKIYDYYNYGDETVMDLLVDISRDDGTWISIYYEYVPIEYLLDEDIVITAEYITSVDGAILDDGGNLDLRFKLTYDANDRIKLISVPETRALTLAETVFYSYLNGENEYGAEMDSAVEEIYDYGTTMRIYFYSGFDLKSIAYTLKYDIERDVFVGTITGVSVDSDHRLINADGNGYYGFNDDPNMMNAYFDGDPTFELYYDEETNTILFVEYPVVVEEYRSGW